ncbi:hypothetical protein ACVWZV_003219 [Bradyrhizobium sp. GM5.1]
MQRGNRGLDLVGPAAAMAYRLVDQREAFRDHRAVPQRTILVVQQDQRAIRGKARGTARMLQQDERRESHDLRLALEQPQQQPRQPDRFLAQRLSDFGGVAARRIALVEDQIDHRRDNGEPLRALDRARRFKRRPGLRDLGLGTRDALLHRRFRHQERRARSASPSGRRRCGAPARSAALPAALDGSR